MCRYHLSWRRRIAFGGQANVIPSFCRMKASGERAAAPDPEHDRQAANLVSERTRWPFFARDDQAERMSLQRLPSTRPKKPASRVRQPSRTVAVGLVSRKRLARLVGRLADSRDRSRGSRADRDHESVSAPSVRSRKDPPIASGFRQFAGDRLCPGHAFASRTISDSD